MYIFIYIYIYIEREREIHIPSIHTHIELAEEAYQAHAAIEQQHDTASETHMTQHQRHI